jgi:hypothetical protein
MTCSSSLGHAGPAGARVLPPRTFAGRIAWSVRGARSFRYTFATSLLGAGIGLLLLYPAAPAHAQPSFSIEAGRSLDAIAFGVGESGSRGVTSVAAGAEVVLAAERLRLHHAFDAQTYSTPGDWLSLVHRGGATWKAAFGPRAGHALFAGFALTFRHNGESWAAADYRGAAAFLNVELRPAPTFAVRSGYQVDRRAFPDLPVLDQTEHRAFGSVLVNLPSRTTIIGEVAAGWKAYEGGTGAPDVPDLESAMNAGAVSVPGTGTSATGQRRGTGRPLIVPTASPTFIVRTGAPRTTARQVTVFGRVAQSLAARLGLSVDLSAREVFGAVPPALLTTPAGFFDDGVYDDPYASDARMVRATLKRVWPSLAELSASVSWFDRRYTGTPASDAAGVPLPDGSLRRDDVRRARLTVRLPIAPDRTGRLALALVGGCGWLRHRSTDAFYRYTSQSAGIGLSLGY